MKSKQNPEFDAFTRTVDKLLLAPHKELQRREKEYREQVARNPRKSFAREGACLIFRPQP
jgi:hypothetical protein